MQIRILDLDGSVTAQPAIADRFPTFHAADWGPRIRLACGHGRFRSFERHLTDVLGGSTDPDPTVTFCGSGDFHHVSLALLRRQVRPFNLLVLDNHPDWMRGVPLLHCGTWLYHAARLPLLEHIYHVGGDVDFDNGYRWLAPWKLLGSGRITVVPARRRYQGGHWHRLLHVPLRTDPQTPAGIEWVAELVRPWAEQLTRHPLYISFDKDVLTADEAVVNWDSGHLTLDEARTVLKVFLAAARQRLAGMDTVGDWSPVRVSGLLRRLLQATEHPPLSVVAEAAAPRNQRVNLALLEAVGAERSVVSAG
jgi:hypothetical protein